MPTPIAEGWWRLFRTTGGVEVSHVDLTPDGAREAEAYARLDESERERCRRFQHPGPQRRFALCRAALRAILSRRLGCGDERLAFGAAPYTKPYAVLEGQPAPIAFNVSHSGDHGLIAVASKGRLGVDVEERVTRHDLDGPIAGVLGPDERARLAAADGDEKLRLFFYFWTLKEALLKAIGTGHGIEMSRFQVPKNMRSGETTGIFRFPHLPTATWRLESLDTKDFAAALAYDVMPDA